MRPPTRPSSAPSTSGDDRRCYSRVWRPNSCGWGPTPRRVLGQNRIPRQPAAHDIQPHKRMTGGLWPPTRPSSLSSTSGDNRRCYSRVWGPNSRDWGPTPKRVLGQNRIPREPAAQASDRRVAAADQAIKRPLHFGGRPTLLQPRLEAEQLRLGADAKTSLGPESHPTTTSRTRHPAAQADDRRVVAADQAIEPFLHFGGQPTLLQPRLGAEQPRLGAGAKTSLGPESHPTRASRTSE